MLTRSSSNTAIVTASDSAAGAFEDTDNHTSQNDDLGNKSSPLTVPSLLTNPTSALLPASSSRVYIDLSTDDSDEEEKMDTNEENEETVANSTFLSQSDASSSSSPPSLAYPSPLMLTRRTSRHFQARSGGSSSTSHSHSHHNHSDASRICKEVDYRISPSQTAAKQLSLRVKLGGAQGWYDISNLDATTPFFTIIYLACCKVHIEPFHRIRSIQDESGAIDFSRQPSEWSRCVRAALSNHSRRNSSDAVVCLVIVTDSAMGGMPILQFIDRNDISPPGFESFLEYEKGLLERVTRNRESLPSDFRTSFVNGKFMLQRVGASVKATSAANLDRSISMDDLPFSTCMSNWSVCSYASVEHFEAHHAESRKGFYQEKRANIQEGQPTTLQGVLHMKALDTRRSTVARDLCGVMNLSGQLETSPLHHPIAEVIQQRHLPMMQFHIHSTSPRLQHQYPCTRKKLTDPLNRDFSHLADSIVVFDACILNSDQMWIQKNVILRDAPTDRNVHMVLLPITENMADAYLLTDQQLQQCEGIELETWKTQVFEACIGSKSSANQKQQQKHLSALTVEPHLRSIKFPMHAVLDLDKTLILNQRDATVERGPNILNHRMPAAVHPVATTTILNAGGATKSTSAFFSHLPQCNAPVQFVPDVAKFLTDISKLYHVSMLSAGSKAYIDNVVECANATGWLPSQSMERRVVNARGRGEQEESSQHKAHSSDKEKACIDVNRLFSAYVAAGHDHLEQIDRSCWSAQKSLRLCYTSPKQVVGSVVIVDDNEQAWLDDQQQFVYNVMPATLANNNIGHSAGNNSSSNSTLNRCRHALINLHSVWMHVFRIRLWRRLIDQPVRRCWAHLLYLHLHEPGTEKLQQELFELLNKKIKVCFLQVDSMDRDLIRSVAPGRREWDLLTDFITCIAYSFKGTPIPAGTQVYKSPEPRELVLTLPRNELSVKPAIVSKLSGSKRSLESHELQSNKSARTSHVSQCKMPGHSLQLAIDIWEMAVNQAQPMSFNSLFTDIIEPMKGLIPALLDKIKFHPGL